MRKYILLAVFISLFFVASAQSQERSWIYISGKFVRATDAVVAYCYSDGELIDSAEFTGRFYGFEIGERPHYTIKFTSGDRVKYCHVVTNFMEVENIIVDVDFAKNFDALIYLDKPRAKAYKMISYDNRQMLVGEIERIKGGF